MSEDDVPSLSDSVSAGSPEAVEEAWMARLESGDLDLEEFARVAAELVERGRGEEAQPLVALLLEQLLEGERREGEEALVRRVLSLFPDDRTLAQPLSGLAERCGDAFVVALLRIVEGTKGDSRRRRVLGGLERRPGTFVRMSGHPDALRVTALEAGDEAGFLVDDGEEQRRIPFHEGLEVLRPVSDEDFFTRLRFRKEDLVAEAKEDPSRLLRRVLASVGGRIEGDELKRLLARGVVAPNQFRRWWTRARPLVERDPMVQVFGEDNHPILILRDEPLSHEEELGRRLSEQDDPLKSLAVVREYAESVSEGHAADEAFVGRLLDFLAETARGSEAPIAAVAAAETERLARVAGRDSADAADPAALLADEALLRLPDVFPDEETLRFTLAWLERHGGQAWPAFASRLLGRLPGRLAESVAQGLLDAGRTDEVRAAVQNVLETPHRHPEGLLWLFRSFAAGRLDALPVEVEPFAVALQLLRLVDRVARQKGRATPSQRAFLQRARAVVPQHDHRAWKRLVPALDGERARALFSVVHGNAGLSETSKRRLETLLEEHHHDAIHGKKELWEEDVLYTSPAGLRRREKEFEQLVNVEMAKNSAAIGHAADFGDLSENAEFTAALEQRDFLSRRANEIGEEIRRARIIPIEEIDTDRVNVGTRVRVRDTEGGGSFELVFLGPWDADPDRGIYSYKTPFARAFLGRRVGDVVEASGDSGPRKLEILAIERAELPE